MGPVADNQIQQIGGLLDGLDTGIYQKSLSHSKGMWSCSSCLSLVPVAFAKVIQSVQI